MSGCWSNVTLFGVVRTAFGARDLQIRLQVTLPADIIEDELPKVGSEMLELSPFYLGSVGTFMNRVKCVEHC